MITSTSAAIIITFGFSVYAFYEILIALSDYHKALIQRVELIAAQITRLELANNELKYEHIILQRYCEQNFTTLYKKNWEDIAQQIDQSNLDC